MSFSNAQETGRSVSIKDEGVTQTLNVASLDFTGAGVTASAIGSAATADIPGGGPSTAPAGSSGQPQFNDSGAFGAMSNWNYAKATGRLGIGGGNSAPTPTALIHILSDGTYDGIRINQTNCCGMMLDLQRNGVTTVSVDWAGSFACNAVFLTGTSNSIRSSSFQNGFAFFTPAGAIMNIHDTFTVMNSTYLLGFSSNSEVDGSSHNLDAFLTRAGPGIIQVNTSSNNLGTSPTLGSMNVLGLNVSGLTVSSPVFTDGSNNLTSSGIVPVANGGTGQSASRRLFSHIADVNNTNTSETDLYSDSVPAGKLASNGDSILAEYAGVFSGAVSATQELRVYFGGTLIFDSGALAIGVASPSWDIFVSVVRVDSANVRCAVSITTSSAALAASSQYTAVTGLTLANAQVIKVTGQAGGVAGASSQITSKMGYVDYEPI